VNRGSIPRTVSLPLPLQRMLGLLSVKVKQPKREDDHLPVFFNIVKNKAVLTYVSMEKFKFILPTFLLNTTSCKHVGRRVVAPRIPNFSTVWR
jgi:hypothetical protein